MTVQKRIVDSMGMDLGRHYAAMWDMVVKAAHQNADGLPRMQEIAVEVSWEFVRARQRFGDGESTLEALTWLVERLEKKMAKLRQLKKLEELAEENDLPTVEELERIDWAIHVADPSSPSRYEFAVQKPVRGPFPEGGPTLEDMQMDTITVTPTVRMHLDNAPDGLRWVGLGFTVEAEAIILFKGREYRP